jgi:hypothetical protein
MTAFPGSSLRLFDRRRYPVAHERECEPFVLLRRDLGWMVRQHEYGHLELVVTDVRVGVVRHLERPPPHENGTGFLDQGVHVGRFPQVGEVEVETAGAAVRIGDESVE